MANINRTAI